MDTGKSSTWCFIPLTPCRFPNPHKFLFIKAYFYPFIGTFHILRNKGPPGLGYVPSYLAFFFFFFHIRTRQNKESQKPHSVCPWDSTVTMETVAYSFESVHSCEQVRFATVTGNQSTPSDQSECRSSSMLWCFKPQFCPLQRLCDCTCRSGAWPVA